MENQKDKFFIPTDPTTKRCKMQEEFIFYYSSIDGYHSPIFGISLLVDIEFKVHLKISFANNSGKVEVEITISLPINLKRQLERLSNQLDLNESFEHDFSHPGASLHFGQRFIYKDLNSNTLSYFYDNMSESNYDKEKKQERIRMKLEMELAKWARNIFETIQPISGLE